MTLCSAVYPATDRTDHVIVCDLPMGHGGEHLATVYWSDEEGDDE